MTPDLINGLFEFTGGFFIWMNCLALIKDKTVRGVYVPTTIFWTAWGFWNTYFYPSLDQWWSFVGGLVVVSANCIWIYLAVKFTITWRGLMYSIINKR